MSHEERIEAIEKELAAVKAKLNSVCAHGDVRPVSISLFDSEYGTTSNRRASVVDTYYQCQDCGINQRSPFGSAFKKAIAQ